MSTTSMQLRENKGIQKGPENLACEWEIHAPAIGSWEFLASLVQVAEEGYETL